MPRQSLIAMGSACIGEVVTDTRFLDNAGVAHRRKTNPVDLHQSVPCGLPMVILWRGIGLNLPFVGASGMEPRIIFSIHITLTHLAILQR